MKNKIVIGWSSRDVTPQGKVSLCGQFHLRITNEVHDPLTTTALALEAADSSEQAIIVSLDAAMISDYVKNGCRKILSEKLPDFKAEKMFISVTHTHTAPGQPGFILSRRPEINYVVMSDNEYGDLLIKKISEAAIEAWDGRKTGALSWGKGHAVVGFNRRVSYFDGSTVMYGKADVPEFSNIEGYEDHSVDMLFTYDNKHKLTGMILNVPCPSQCSESAWFISADYWHETREIIRTRHGKKHNLYVIEDACQAHGATYKGRKAGTMGDCAAFSLNQNKCLSSGEGGIFVTDNETIFNGASKLWSFGETARPEQSRDYHAYALGWMYRNNEITAAFARAQLAKYPQYFKMLCANGNFLQDNLKGVKGLLLPYVPEECVHNWYNYNLRVDFDALGIADDKERFRDAVAAAIRAEGVVCSVWQRFILPEMTVFRAKNAYGGGYPWSIPGADEGVDYVPENYPNALRYSKCHMSIVQTLRAPNGLDIAAKAVEAIKKVFNNIDQIDPDKILNQR